MEQSKISSLEVGSKPQSESMQNFFTPEFLVKDVKFNGKFQCYNTTLDGVKVLQAIQFADQRGYFQEIIRDCDFQILTGGKHILQINQSFSVKNVIRGLHYQKPRPQDKLVQVIQGCICDVAVDLRRSSPTFLQSISVKLDANKGQFIYIPAGFAHGFSVLSEQATVCYLCSDYFDPSSEHGLNYNDPCLKVNWMMSPEDFAHAIVSPKDQCSPYYQDLDLFA